MAPQRIYLAGPEVFLKNAKEVGEKKKALCRKYGFEGVYPIDIEVKAEGKNPREFGLCISTVNEGLIRGCQVLIANLTPFRGPSADVGTVFEVGFAHALGKLVLAYSNVAESFAERTVKALNGKVVRDGDGLLRDEREMFVEENGLVDNLMIDGSIDANSGVLMVEHAPAEELFTYLGGFEKCLIAAQKTIKTGKGK